MIEQERKILHGALCRMLPYGVKFIVKATVGESPEGEIKVSKVATMSAISEKTVIVKFDNGGGYMELPLESPECRPVLRPMEWMEEKELREFTDFASQTNHSFWHCGSRYWYNAYEEEDWLEAHHFDYRGLLKMGLAIDDMQGLYID